MWPPRRPWEAAENKIGASFSSSCNKYLQTVSRDWSEFSYLFDSTDSSYIDPSFKPQRINFSQTMTINFSSLFHPKLLARNFWASLFLHFWTQKKGFFAYVLWICFLSCFGSSRRNFWFFFYDWQISFVWDFFLCLHSFYPPFFRVRNECRFCKKEHEYQYIRQK